MANLIPGTIIGGGIWASGTQWKGILLRDENRSAQVLLPGTGSFERGVVRKMSYPANEAGGTTFKKESFGPHGLSATPVHEPLAPIAGWDDAFLNFLDEVVPGAGAALRAVPHESVSFPESYFSSLNLSRTSAGLRIAVDVSEFESRDMVQVEHAWRWAALYEPLVVVGAYIGDRGKQLQVIHEKPLPESSLPTLFARLGVQ